MGQDSMTVNNVRRRAGEPPMHRRTRRGASAPRNTPEASVGTRGEVGRAQQAGAATQEAHVQTEFSQARVDDIFNYVTRLTGRVDMFDNRVEGLRQGMNASNGEMLERLEDLMDHVHRAVLDMSRAKEAYETSHRHQEHLEKRMSDLMRNLNKAMLGLQKEMSESSEKVVALERKVNASLPEPGLNRGRGGSGNVGQDAIERFQRLLVELRDRVTKVENSIVRDRLDIMRIRELKANDRARKGFAYVFQ